MGGTQPTMIYILDSRNTPTDKARSFLLEHLSLGWHIFSPRVGEMCMAVSMRDLIQSLNPAQAQELNMDDAHKSGPVEYWIARRARAYLTYSPESLVLIEIATDRGAEYMDAECSGRFSLFTSDEKYRIPLYNPSGGQPSTLKIYIVG